MAAVIPTIEGRQWCKACHDADPDRDDGAWVDMEGHEHPLDAPRAEVYLYEPAHDGQREKWAAFLPISLAYPIDDSHWLGWREFDTLPEAMDYARKIAIAEYLRRTETWIECPHWTPGRITLRRGCTACDAERERER